MQKAESYVAMQFTCYVFGSYGIVNTGFYLSVCPETNNWSVNFANTNNVGTEDTNLENC
jgi:hypothetical protein